MADLAGMIGGLVPTFIISRLFHWLFRRANWQGTVSMIVANILSWAACAAIVVMQKPPDWRLVANYVVSQNVWLIVDVIRHRNKNATL